MNFLDTFYRDRVIVLETIRSLEVAQMKLEGVIQDLIDGLDFIAREYNELQSWKGKSGEKAVEDLSHLYQQLSHRIISLQDQKGKLIEAIQRLEFVLHSLNTTP